MSSIVPATAPEPNGPMPDPRVTVALAMLSAGSAVKGMKPKKASACGTPSSVSSVRDEALPPRLRSVMPCALGLAERLSERRNCWKPGMRASASSRRPDAVAESLSPVMVTGP